MTLSGFPNHRRAFTLVETLVVVGIIAFLTAILFPSIRYAQNSAALRQCLSTTRQIAATVQTYAAENTGWTPFDADYYVKKAGYRLCTDPGWSSVDAAQVKDFICPHDNQATANRHGIRSSYQMALAGQNLNTLDQASRTVLVQEVGNRHRKAGKLTRHFAFADLSAQLGANPDEFFQGLQARWWRVRAITTAVQWTQVKSNTYVQANWTGYANDSTQTGVYSPKPDFVSLWIRPLQEDRFDFLPQAVPPGDNDWTLRPTLPDRPESILLRMDGYIEFPKAGQWFILSYTNDEIYVWIDVDGNGLIGAGEDASVTFGSTLWLVRKLTNLQASVKYRCTFAYREETGKQRMNVYWTQDALAATNVGQVRTSLIPASALFFQP